MCWRSNDTVIKKVAKRDFYVYKIGRASDKGFKSLYQNFIYEPKEINKKVELNPIQFFKDESSYVIYEGYHSYKDITMPYSGLRSYYRTIYLGKIAEDIRLYNIYSIATFIIPKGSEYYENDGGEIVSSNIIYTGKYVRIGNSEEQLCVGQKEWRM